MMHVAQLCSSLRADMEGAIHAVHELFNQHNGDNSIVSIMLIKKFMHRINIYSPFLTKQYTYLVGTLNKQPCTYISLVAKY